MKYRVTRSLTAAISLISVLLVAGTIAPGVTHAGMLSMLIASIRGNTAFADARSGSGNVQTMPLLEPAMNINPAPDKGGGDIVIVDNTALLPEEGPSGTIADISKPKNATISLYVVRDGDSLSSIGKLFDVSPNTILWANDLPRGSVLRVGQTLTILPVTGVKYTIRSGDTLASVAKRFSADADEISSFNGLDNASLVAGIDIIIPDGEIAAPPKASASASARVVVGTGKQIGYYLAPLSRYSRTQGIHGYNGVDLAAPVGTQVMAAAAGAVIVAKQGGYNGGYGSYVVIQHQNGSQTLYAHNSANAVSVGQYVTQGQVIGSVGSTGKSTGAHLHLEIRNGIRNPF